MARGHLCGTLISELSGRRQPAGMVDQRIAKTDPQLRIAGIPRHCVLENADRVLASSVACQCLGNSKPALGRSEIAEEGVACVGQRKDVMAFAPSGRRTGLGRPALERIARRTEKQSRCARGK